MNKEKVMYVVLPKGAKYRKIYATEDGKIAIEYTEEVARDAIEVSEAVPKTLPKPEPLVGGTEVYQKEGLPYWYCKIKDGRDEFMYLYFGDLSSNDILYTTDGRERKFATSRQEKFKVNVMKALENKPEEGFRWIPVYEPSIENDCSLQYVAGKFVSPIFSSYDWKKAFQNYSPENGSKMATITTYFLLLLRLLKDGFATIEQLADDSKEIGHYCDRRDTLGLERTGERQLGGLYGFAGNTRKIVKDSEPDSGFSILGGNCNDYGSYYPLADVEHDYHPNTIGRLNAGLLELTK